MKPLKEIAKGKTSEECSFDERVNVYRMMLKGADTIEERKKRINAFRCGW